MAITAGSDRENINFQMFSVKILFRSDWFCCTFIIDVWLKDYTCQIFSTRLFIEFFYIKVQTYTKFDAEQSDELLNIK